MASGVPDVSAAWVHAALNTKTAEAVLRVIESSGLYEACFLESGEGAALLDGLESASRDSEVEGLLELRHVNLLFREVWVLSNHASWVELGSTSGV